MVDENPIGFLTEDDAGYDEVEASSGFAGEDLLEKQWALLRVKDAEYRAEEGKTPCVHTQLELDKTYSGQPGRTTWHDVWLSTSLKGQPMIDGFFLAIGLGKLDRRFGGNDEKDKRPKVPKAQFKEIGTFLAKSSKGRSFIGFIDVEPGGKKRFKQGGEWVEKVVDDRNKISGTHRQTDERLAAIKEAGFLGKCIRIEGDEKKFVVKPKTGAERPRPKGGAPSVIN